MRTVLFRALLLFAALFSISLALQAQQPAPLITNVEHRSTISLNGAWNTIIDPYDNGFYDYRRKPLANGYWKNAKPRTSAELIEYDFDKSPTLNVPGDWNSRVIPP